MVTEKPRDDVGGMPIAVLVFKVVVVKSGFRRNVARDQVSRFEWQDAFLIRIEHIEETFLCPRLAEYFIDQYSRAGANH